MSGVLFKCKWLCQLSGEGASCKMDVTHNVQFHVVSFLLGDDKFLVTTKVGVWINLKGV